MNNIRYTLCHNTTTSFDFVQQSSQLFRFNSTSSISCITCTIWDPLPLPICRGPLFTFSSLENKKQYSNFSVFFTFHQFCSCVEVTDSEAHFNVLLLPYRSYIYNPICFFLFKPIPTYVDRRFENHSSYIISKM